MPCAKEICSTGPAQYLRAWYSANFASSFPILSVPTACSRSISFAGGSQELLQEQMLGKQMGQELIWSNDNSVTFQRQPEIATFPVFPSRRQVQAQAKVRLSAALEQREVAVGLLEHTVLALKRQFVVKRGFFCLMLYSSLYCSEYLRLLEEFSLAGLISPAAMWSHLTHAETETLWELIKSCFSSKGHQLLRYFENLSERCVSQATQKVRGRARCALGMHSLPATPSRGSSPCGT